MRGRGGRLRAPQSLVKNSSGSLSRERPFGSVSGFWPNWHRGAAGTLSGDAPTAAIRAIGCSCKADAPASTRRDRRMRAKAMLSRQERSRQRCVGGGFFGNKKRATRGVRVFSPHSQQRAQLWTLVTEDAVASTARGSLARPCSIWRIPAVSTACAPTRAAVLDSTPAQCSGCLH